MRCLKANAALVLVSWLLGSVQAFAQEGGWEVREANHPALGPIRFAFLTRHVVTAVGPLRIFTRPYVSCEKSAGKIAIELTHGMSPQDTNGLQPKSVPILTCRAPSAGSQKTLVREEILARWAINQIGDVLARGLPPAQLRQCAAIEVEQEVKLPQAPGTARVVFEIAPSDKALDAILAACGEPAAPAEKSPPTPISTWRTVRTISTGKTNVRARPTTESPVVLQLEAGAIVTVQAFEGEWWRARASGGRSFDGYIRQDRLVLK